MSDQARQASFGWFADQALEVITLWTEANQKVIREVADFTLGAAAEGIRVAGEVQSAVAESAGRLQDRAQLSSGKIRAEMSQALSEAERRTSPARG